jgi:hypothetical protein
MKPESTDYLLLRKPSGCIVVRNDLGAKGHEPTVEAAVRVADGMLANPLDLRLDLWSHSPTGFEWGYEGSGPAQTALAILADFTEDDEVASRLHQQYKRDVIAGLDRSATSIVIEGSEIRAWLFGQPDLVCLGWHCGQAVGPPYWQGTELYESDECCGEGEILVDREEVELDNSGNVVMGPSRSCDSCGRDLEDSSHFHLVSPEEN